MSLCVVLRSLRCLDILTVRLERSASGSRGEAAQDRGRMRDGAEGDYAVRSIPAEFRTMGVESDGTHTGGSRKTDV